MVEDQVCWESLHAEQIERARLLEKLWHSRGITLVPAHPPQARAGALRNSPLAA
jgi:hypothetical protein